MHKLIICSLLLYYRRWNGSRVLLFINPRSTPSCFVHYFFLQRNDMTAMNIMAINNRLFSQFRNIRRTKFSGVSERNIFTRCNSSKLIAATATTTVALGSSIYFSSRSYCAGITEADTLVRPQIFQYKICPFCSRVKAYLDFLNIEYDSIEVNPLNKEEIKFSTVKKVPVATIGETVIEDSNNIINFISSSMISKSSKGIDPSKFVTEDTQQWNEWSEKKLAVMLYPNITRSFSESWECFEYSNHVSTWTLLNRTLVRVVGPIGMSFANGRIKKKYGIVDERKELHAVINEWCSALNGKKFLHGDEVSLPDVLVFGVLRSIEGLTTFNEVMAENQVLREWYQNVHKLAPSCERK